MKKDKKIGTIMIAVGGYFAVVTLMLVLLSFGISSTEYDNGSGMLAGGAVPLAIAGGTLLFLGIKKRKNVQKLQRYVDIVTIEEETSVAAIAEAVGVSKLEATENLQSAIDKGYLKGAINRKKGIIILERLAESNIVSKNKHSKCPNCGARLNSAGKRITRCEYCGTTIE